MRISAAGPDDQAEVVRLWNACELTRPWNDPEADFRMAIEGNTSCVLVARANEEAIEASVMAGCDGHRGWIYYLAVAPGARGKGLARAIMAAAEDWLHERGVAKVRLMVREGNPVSDFYERLGYEVQQVRTLGKTLNGGR